MTAPPADYAGEPFRAELLIVQSALTSAVRGAPEMRETPPNRREWPEADVAHLTRKHPVKAAGRYGSGDGD